MTCGTDTRSPRAIAACTNLFKLQCKRVIALIRTQSYPYPPFPRIHSRHHHTRKRCAHSNTGVSDTLNVAQLILHIVELRDIDGIGRIDTSSNVGDATLAAGRSYRHGIGLIRYRTGAQGYRVACGGLRPRTSRDRIIP